MHAFWYGLLNFFGIRNESGPGYAFWSGAGGNLGMLGALSVYLRHRNCHVPGCKSILTHPDPATGLPSCRRHHPHMHPKSQKDA